MWRRRLSNTKRPQLRALRVLLTQYAMKFGVVGTLGLILDIGVFNALRIDPSGSGPILDSSFVAKTISVSIAIVATWFGNRHWTFRDRRRHDFLREFVEFAAIAAFGMTISLGCLFVSRTVFGFESLFADNIATNVVGLALGTTFRFLMYRFWVYGDGRQGSIQSAQRATSAAIIV
jgi:putative flippase GtrA